ncbi:MAG: membrane-binding protein [Peptococcaceae bacterium]|jgi:hypothetical protein|nr:membrane-binding protein [Peptococcaceae bacterium]
MGLILSGEIQGITVCEKNGQGGLTSCQVKERNVLSTVYGDFVPRYSRPDFRRKDRSALTFFDNGSVKSIELEEQSPVRTPLGVWEAEFITFDEAGNLNSIFPRNGKLGFAWSEDDEATLVPAYDFSLPCGSFRAKLISARFFPSGALRCVTVWPDERLELTTPLGPLPVRIGFRLHEDGSLAAAEPDRPVKVTTPIGEITAYDSAAVGLDASSGSLRFDPQGTLRSLATAGSLTIRNLKTGEEEAIVSQPLAGFSECTQLGPLFIRFEGEAVYVDDGAGEKRYERGGYAFDADFDAEAADGFSCAGGCDSCASGG